MTLTAEQQRALELLADSRLNGATEASLLINGIGAATLAELERAGWATSSVASVRAGGKTIEVRRYRITDAGSKALEAASSFRC
jgi:hypothetical protein